MNKVLYIRFKNEIATKKLFDSFGNDISDQELAEFKENLPKFNKDLAVINQGETINIKRRNNEYRKGEKGAVRTWSDPFDIIELNDRYTSDDEVKNELVLKNKELKKYVKYLYDYNGSDEIYLVKGNNWDEVIDNYINYIRLLKKLICGDYKKPIFKLKDGPQKENKKHIINWRKNKSADNKEYLVYIACRGGKSFIELEDFCSLEYKYGIHISGKTDSIRGIFETYDSCSNFTDKFTLITMKRFRNLTEEEQKSGRYFITTTCQYYQSNKKAIRQLFSDLKINDIIYFDECHYYDTKDIEELIKTFDEEIYLSGTPHALIESGRFNEFNTYEYNLLNLMKDKKAGKPWAINQPTPIFFTSDISGYIERNVKYSKLIRTNTLNIYKDSGFDIQTLVEQDGDGNFYRYDEAQLILESIIKFLLARKIKTCMIFGPRGVKDQKLKKLYEMINNILKNMAIKGECLLAAGDNDNKSNDRIKYEFDQLCMGCNNGELDIAILLSWQKFSTGVTFEYLDSEYIMSEPTNVTTLIQMWGRPGSQNDEGTKDEYPVYYLNKQQLTSDIFKSFIAFEHIENIYSVPAKVLEKKFKEFIEMINVYDVVKSGEVVELNVDFNSCFMSYNKLVQYDSFKPIDTISKEELIILKSLESSVEYTANNFFTNDCPDKLKKGTKLIETVKEKQHKQKTSKISDKEIKELWFTFCKNVKTFWYYTKPDSYEELEKIIKENNTMFNDVVGVDYKAFCKLINTDEARNKLVVICKAFNKCCNPDIDLAI